MEGQNSIILHSYRDFGVLGKSIDRSGKLKRSLVPVMFYAVHLPDTRSATHAHVQTPNWESHGIPHARIFPEKKYLQGITFCGNGADKLDKAGRSLSR